MGKTSHNTGTRKAEELSQRDSGRQETGRNATGRPSGKSHATDFTGINPEQERPIDPSSPQLIPA